MKKYLGLGLFALMVSGFSLTALFATAQLDRRGPFIVSTVAPDSLTGAQVGGFVQHTIAGTSDTLLVGDVVYWADTNKVKKSATLANYSMIAGVVVGGALIDRNRAHTASTDVGTQAAAPGQWVVILKQGRTWMKSSNNAAWIAGRRVLPSDSIAGRLDTSLTAAVIDTFYRLVGRTVGAAAALGTVLVDVNIK